MYGFQRYTTWRIVLTQYEAKKNRWDLGTVSPIKAYIDNLKTKRPF
jgi:hypothetical protein